MRIAALAAIGIGCLVLAGPDAFGRLALRVGLPQIAAPLLTDPVERGVALYRAGDYARADTTFAKSGRSQTFNRGLSLAAMGEYPLSAAYFDAVLFVNPADAEARRNRELVSTMYPPNQGTSVTPGRIEGHGNLGPAEPTAQTSPGLQDPHVNRKIEARGIAASDEWLATVSDDPGEFLRLRLRAEHDRRAGQGLIRPAEAEPW